MSKAGGETFLNSKILNGFSENSSVEQSYAPKKIGTHDGTFHCDEVLACSMLKCLPEYADSIIIRTRDPEVLSSCDIVVDVGGEYNASKHRYDHHQRSFSESMHSLDESYPWKIKLSSAGLIYFHFGHRIIAKILNEDCQSIKVKNLFRVMYENFVQEVDAMDNGINICGDQEQLYKICTNLGFRIRMLNIPWNQKPQTMKDIEGCFNQACSLAIQEFKSFLQYFAKVWLPAKEVLVEAIAKRYDVHKSGKIIAFESGGVPWREYIYDIEQEQNIVDQIKFILFPDTEGRWRVQAVNVSQTSFKSRIPLKEEWCGLRDEKLCEASGIEGCVFVHISGFIGGNKTREGVLAMADKTLEDAEKDMI